MLSNFPIIMGNKWSRLSESNRRPTVYKTVDERFKQNPNAYSVLIAYPFTFVQSGAMPDKPDSTLPPSGPKANKKKVRRIPVQRKKLAGVSISIQRCSAGNSVAKVVVHRDGRRIGKCFETMEAAKQYAQRQEIEAENAGARAASEIGDTERRALLDAKERLLPFGKTIGDAVHFYIAHLTASKKSSTVTAMVDALLALKMSEVKSPRHLSDLRSRLGRFAKDHGTRPIGDITVDEISAWLAGLNLAPVGTNNFRRCLSSLFNFASQRGFASNNVIRHTMRMKDVDGEIQILTVGECQQMLKSAHASVLPAIVLSLFCGARSAEVEKLDWRAVDWEGDCVIIGANVSKLHQRRIVPLRPNAKAWLAELRQQSGRILPAGNVAKERMQIARIAAGFGSPAACAKDKHLRLWPSNALRHSYASYRLAQWPDAPALALEMGNSPGIILKHYRQLVKPAAAAAFWSLTPL